MTNILGVKGELKTLSKNQLKKLRADINDEKKEGSEQHWNRITANNCGWICNDPCPVIKTCDYLHFCLEDKYNQKVEKVLQAIKEEFVRREKSE